MRPGRDYLLGSNFGDLIIKEHPEGWAAGFILNTTDQPTKKPNAWPVIKRLLQTRRCPEIRNHAVWDDDHIYNERRDLPVILREAKRSIDIKRQFPSVDVQFSWFCEHKERRATIQKVFKAIRKLPGASTITLVNANWRGDFIYEPGVINEVHGSKSPIPKGVYNYSYDGQNVFDSNIVADKRKFRGARTYYLWCPQDNGRETLTDDTPRPDRKAWMYPQLNDSMIYLWGEKGITTFPLQSGFRVWKSHADQHDIPPEARAHNPVLIIPENVRSVDLIAANGQRIDTMTNAGSFKGGGFRYYIQSSRFGFEVAERAKRISGSPVVTLRAGNQVFGTVNPAFREGTARERAN